MSTAWVIGFIVGLLVVVLVSTVLAKAARRKGAGKGEFDERQMAARGRAFTLAYMVLLVYLVFWMVMRSLEVPFFSQSLSVMLGVLASIGVFVGYSIFHDAYFKASESPKPWLVLLCAAGLLNVGIGIWKLLTGETPAERLYENANLFVGLLLVVTLACAVIKRAMDRRAGEE